MTLDLDKKVQARAAAKTEAGHIHHQVVTACGERSERFPEGLRIAGIKFPFGCYDNQLAVYTKLPSQAQGAAFE